MSNKGGKGLSLMQCDSELIKYLNKNYTVIEIIEVLKRNNLYFKFAEKFIEIEAKDTESLALNRMWNSYNRTVACNIFSEIKKIGIKYITFKGTILSQLLYDNPYERASGDVDFFVEPHCFDKVYMYLLEKGFRLLRENGLKNQHHVILTNGRTVVELHRNIFAPQIGIDEAYIRKNTDKINLSESVITTFNTTATFLHLLYHLYMDTCLFTSNLYTILKQKRLPIAKRFLYRAYEIALFSEKYFDKIKWEDIEEDLRHQKLRILFKKMIFDILEIFPNAFPENIKQTVIQLEYIDDELYIQFVNSYLKKEERSIEPILCDFVDEKWLVRKEINVHKRVGDSFALSEQSTNLDNKNNDNLKCKITTEINTDGLKFTFKVSNNDFYFSDIDNYNTHESDGVHLLLCGTQEFFYNSIFFFPKEIDGDIKVICYDVPNNIILDETLVKAYFNGTDTEYTITAIFSNEFIEKNHLDLCFYMGLVISDCSSETKRRKQEIILSEDKSQWFNPIYFAKIDVK